MAELISGADAFEGFVLPLRGGLLDPDGEISEHSTDDWESKRIDTSRSTVRSSFKSSEGSRLSGSVSGSGDESSGSASASVTFTSFDGDSLSYALNGSYRETGSGSSSSGTISMTLATGKGTRERDDDIACTIKASVKAAETLTSESFSASMQVKYTTGTGISLSLQVSGSYRGTETSESGNATISLTYVDLEGNRLELKGSYVYQASETRESYTLKIDKLLVVEAGEELVNVSRLTLREPFEDFEAEDFGFSFDEDEGITTAFESPDDIYVGLAGVLTGLAELLDV